RLPGADRARLAARAGAGRGLGRHRRPPRAPRLRPARPLAPSTLHPPTTRRGGPLEKRRPGPDGPEVSVVGLGCNNFGMRMDADRAAEVVAAALDAGITHFDTAEMYGGGRSEGFLGAALGSRRDQVVIAT